MGDIPKIILASTSPQRRQILEELEIPFQVVSREVEEITGKTPQETVEYNAKLKAETVAGTVVSDMFVLAADTVLSSGDKILGKPADSAEAKSFLAGFSGKTIQAYTGLAIAHRASNSCRVTMETAEIVFRPFSQKMIDWYVGTGEPLTRAGAFGISKRGEILVKSIHGSYSCIAGLPKLATLLLLSTIFEETGFPNTDIFPSPDPGTNFDTMYTPNFLS